MKNIICIQHPKYNPSNAPDLSCKICCRAYVNNILEKQAAQRAEGFSTEKWLEEKLSRNGSDGKTHSN